MTLIDKVMNTPKIVLILIVMSIGLAVIVYRNPLADGCENELKNFSRGVAGVLLEASLKKKNRTQFPLISSQKKACQDGNSSGSCENYFQSIRKITESLGHVDMKCAEKLTEKYSNVLPELGDAIKTMSLLAWGGTPPPGPAGRLGWMSQSDLFTFCRAKVFVMSQLNSEEWNKMKIGIYSLYPQDFPAGIDTEKRAQMPRPLAFKTESNPDGILDENEVFQRSLFSVRCDLYL